jgi:uncharacterized protein
MRKPTSIPGIPTHDGKRSLIGMIHLRPLPGSPRYAGDWDNVLSSALRDAEALASGGASAIMLENFGDLPFFPGRVPANVIASMTAIACAVRRAVDLPLGINVLRNDGQSALAVALASGAKFIRVNVLCGARVTDQGVINGIAHDLLRNRANLSAQSIAIFADVDVKHSAPLAVRPLEDEVEDTVERGLADALIVSGSGTGKRTDPAQVRLVKKTVPDTPVLIGSGASVQTIKSYLPHADGFIVGTAIKVDGRVENAVDVRRVREIAARL